MHDRSRIRGKDGLVRDENSKAILNSNTEAIRSYQQNRALLKVINRLEEQVKKLEQRVDTLEENGTE